MDPNYSSFRSVDVPISAQNDGALVGISVGGTMMYWDYSVYNIR